MTNSVREKGGRRSDSGEGGVATVEREREATTVGE